MRILALVLCVYHGLNGLFMIAMPETWYGLVPGVVDTGPFNDHFVRDIGFGFSAGALGLALAAWRDRFAPALWPAMLFLSGHAALHLVEMVVHGGAPAALLRDLVTILIPGFAPLLLLWRAGVSGAGIAGTGSVGQGARP